MVIVPGPECSVIEATRRRRRRARSRRWTEHRGVRACARLRGVASRPSSRLHDDDGFKEALAKRGITDLDKVQIDPWPTGNFGIAHEENRRVARCISYYRENPHDNGYARPIEGLWRGSTWRAARCSTCVDLRRRAHARRPGQLLPRRQRAAPHRPQAARHRAARRRVLRDRRQPAHVAEVVAARVDGPARRPGAAPGRLRRTGRSCTARRSARWSCPTATPARCTDGRTRSTPASGASAAWPTRSSSAATASARSSTSTGSTPTSTATRPRPRTRSASTKRTSASCGSTSTSTAAAPRCAAQRRLVVSLHLDRRQLRVRLLLVLLPRRLDPARGEAHRHHVDQGDRPRRAAPVHAAASRPASPRRSTSTCSAPGSTSTSTASINEVHEVERRPGRRRATTTRGATRSRRRDASRAPSSRRNATSTRPRSRTGRS